MTPERNNGERRPRPDGGGAARGPGWVLAWAEKLGKVGRVVTPTGVIAPIGIALSIDGSLDRNCRATEDVAQATKTIVAVDNELGKAQNRSLREAVQRQLSEAGSRCE